MQQEPAPETCLGAGGLSAFLGEHQHSPQLRLGQDVLAEGCFLAQNADGRVDRDTAPAVQGDKIAVDGYGGLIGIRPGHGAPPMGQPQPPLEENQGQSKANGDENEYRDKPGSGRAGRPRGDGGSLAGRR